MIEAYVMTKMIKDHKKKEKYTKKNGNKNDNYQMSPAAAIIYFFLMVFSAHNAWNCFPKGRRIIPTILAFLFPIIYWIIRAFVPGLCEIHAQNNKYANISNQMMTPVS